jgi:UDPglucose--hexose-1-phosphate uridylyltransferase
MQQYQEKQSSCLLCDYLTAEMKNQVRLIVQNESFVALIPYWALWPFETMILPKRHVHYLHELTEKASIDLADILQKLTCKYDNLFQCSFPYSMGIHQSPLLLQESFHLHFHFYPPLLRNASVKKFLVG